jgi:hypothetical protein
MKKDLLILLLSLVVHCRSEEDAVEIDLSVFRNPDEGLHKPEMRPRASGGADPQVLPEPGQQLQPQPPEGSGTAQEEEGDGAEEEERRDRTPQKSACRGEAVGT